MLSLFLAAFGETGISTEALEADTMVAEVLRAQGRLRRVKSVDGEWLVSGFGCVADLSGRLEVVA